MVSLDFGSHHTSLLKWAIQLPFFAHAFVDLLLCVAVAVQLISAHMELQKYYSSNLGSRYMANHNTHAAVAFIQLRFHSSVRDYMVHRLRVLGVVRSVSILGLK